MKKLIKFISAILAVATVASGLCLGSASLDSVPAISGETSRTTSEITLSDGTKTGVQYTNIQLSGTYGNNRELNIADADLSNTHLSLEVLNHGTYSTSVRTLANGISEYNSANDGKTVLAAVNGDLWLTSYHTHSGVMKKSLAVTRGVMFIDGEIWATQQLDQENIEATNAEKGAAVGYKMAFGVTRDNQPIFGSPQIEFKVDIGKRTVYADGMNRLPATDSLIVYNHRIASSNYALDDAYEVVITVDETSNIMVEGSVSGTITAVYEPDSETRPSLSDKSTIVLTARGSRLEELQKYGTVGKRVTITTSVSDPYGRDELWKNVDDAIGGHMTVFNDGVGTDYTDTTAYPTTLIGYKDDGTVSLVTVTSTLDNSRAALKFSQAYELCDELGFNCVFYLDGGGSTTFASLENGSYTVRNKCSDSSGARSVVNSVAIVWNDTPLIKRQGHLNYMEVPIDTSEISPVHMDGAMIYDSLRNPNCVSLGYDEENNAAVAVVNTDTNDPFVTLDYSGFAGLEASDYPYIIFKVKTSLTSSNNFGLYYACGSDTGASGERTVNASVNGTSSWQYISFNMKSASVWSGNINSIRLDVFNSGTYAAGDTMYIASVTLCKSASEANSVRSGALPDGACTNYSELKEALKPTPYYINGDTSCDGKVNIADLFKIKMMLVGLSDVTPSASWAADVDGSSSLNLKDCFELKYYVSTGLWSIQ